jgi:hypothetical protein
MSDKNRGLYQKFNVSRTDGSSKRGGKHYECQYFVLDLSHDPLALPAIEAYAKAAGRAGYQVLADDLGKIAFQLRNSMTQGGLIP